MERKEKDFSLRRKFIRRFGLSLGTLAVAGPAAVAGESAESGSGEKVCFSLLT